MKRGFMIRGGCFAALLSVAMSGDLSGRAKPDEGDFDDSVDEKINDGDLAPAERQDPDEGFFALMLRDGVQDTSAAATRARLRVVLKWKIASVEWVCELAEVQKEKLRLAGRGDIERLIDRVETWKERQRREREAVEGEGISITAKDRDEVELLQDELKSGPFGAKSQFVKVLRTSASFEEFADYDLVQQFERDGGRIRTLGEGPIQITGLDLKTAELSENCLKSLRKLRHLRALSLEGTPVNDSDLACLEGLTELVHLDLSRTSITDGGMAKLEGLGALRSLNLRDAKVTDVGLVHLLALRGLESLNLDQTATTDVGLKHVRVLKDLEFLSCRNSDVTRSGIAMLMTWRPRLNVAR